MKKVLCIDDEINSPKWESKIEIIESMGIEFIKIDSVENVMNSLNENINNIGLIILDIIMPYEMYSLEETNAGTTTGLRLLEDIRNKYSDIPIMLVSIKRKNNMENIDYIIEKYKISEFLEKQMVTANDIGNAIKKIIS